MGTHTAHERAHGTRAHMAVGGAPRRCVERCVQLGPVSSWLLALRLLRRRQVWPLRPLGRGGDRLLLLRKDADPWMLVPTEPSCVETVVGTHFVEGLEVGSGGEETSLSILLEALPCFSGRSRCTRMEPGRAGHRLTQGSLGSTGLDG